MMRYQRVSPDIIGLPNGRKPASIRSCKEEDASASGRLSSCPPFDAKPLRIRSAPGSGSITPTTTQTQENYKHSDHFSHLSDPHTPEKPKYPNGRCSGDVLLQWGHKKRSRGSRAENRAIGAESTVHPRQHVKIQRRAAIAGAEKIAAAAAAQAMPPPCGGGCARGPNLRACMPMRDSMATHRNSNFEERSTGNHSRSERSPGFGPEAAYSMNQREDSAKPLSDQDTGGSGGGGGAAAAGGGVQEKVNMEEFEWPMIYISLSRKEKEDDFLAMKGAKLPLRPKKRAKNIEKAIQSCLPGMWLSDLTRGRYEVREKKRVKKKRRGLKGMERMDSDSE